MATLETAKAKWARKMSTAGAKWKAGVSGKQGAYETGMASFLGVGAITRGSAWASGVGAVSESEFQSAVSGKEEKWARKLKEAMTG